ncbi:MAG: hypothetical protein H6Q72_2618 [Firmicutes bacterium]|nr:hypothetical protein [Bacillota bacterium]
MHDMTVLTSKITVPTLGVDVVLRPNLQARLGKIPQHAVSTLIAGAGYGKTTALVQYLVSQDLPVCWYNPGPEDDDVYSFSVYLAGALNLLLPGLKDWYFGKARAEEKFDWKIAFALLMGGIEQFAGTESNGILVIDDWQYVQADAGICLLFDRFLACCPRALHVVILSREATRLPEVERLRAQKNVLDLTYSELTFDLDDIKNLFFKVGNLPISPQQAQEIFTCTEGWSIAIKLLASQWQTRPVATPEIETDDLDGLFEYLAQDVLGRQTPELQKFLLKSALVESFSVNYCKEVFGAERSAWLLKIALDKGLFIYRIGQGVFRYHTLFREFLCREAEVRLPDLTSLYAQIGYYFWKQENAERALHYLSLGEQWEIVQKIVCEVGRRWVNSGRDRLLGSVLEQLPEQYRQHPDIFLALGDAARFSCNYDQAIAWYQQAGQQFQNQHNINGWSQACRGIGETYLDIIQPVYAQSYLKQAYRGLQAEQIEEKTTLLGLMSENMINQGDSRRAERYYSLMVGMRPCIGEDQNNLYVRILLRTGRLTEVIDILERRYAQEQTSYHVPRSFRESPLVLSLCYTYIGQGERALQLAQAGIESVERLRSPFVAVIGYVRFGHALLLDYRHNRERCRETYKKALELAEHLGILRGQTEVCQGRSLMYALDGEWLAAKKIGLEGIKITEKVHDEWFTAVLYHTLGMGGALCGFFDEAKQFLIKAMHLFERCRDTFGQTACCWWFTFLAYQQQDKSAFGHWYGRLLANCGSYGYEFILERPSMLGDIAGFSSKKFQQWAEELRLAEECIVAVAENSPLVIRTLGGLKVWREGEEISPQEWRRAGAKQLLCLLLTLRKSMTTKEKLMLYLWPDADAEAATRSFKVVFNQLCNVLEPERQLRKPCRSIARQGTAYRLLVSECQLDVERFENLLDEGRSLQAVNPGQAQQILQSALEIYQGEYLEGETLDEFSLKERERLETLALHGAELLAALCIEQEDCEEAINWTEWILQRDSCWEKAYQLRMICYGKLGNRVMLARAYKRCLAVLEEEMGVEPSPLTNQIYSQYGNTG